MHNFEVVSVLLLFFGLVGFLIDAIRVHHCGTVDARERKSREIADLSEPARKRSHWE